MRSIASNAWAWLCDYWYVVWVFAGAAFSKADPKKYTVPNDASGFNKIEVVLIPGVYEDWHFMRPIANDLHSQGYRVHILEGLGHNRGTVEAMATLVEEYAAKNISNDYVIVSHSKGGLIGKFLLLSPQRTVNLRGLIALNAPFAGSVYAYLLPPIPSLSIFRPHSKIIEALRRNTSQNANIVSIYGEFDPHIPSGSRLEGARNVQLPTKGHFKILSDKLVIKAVRSAVAEFART